MKRQLGLITVVMLVFTCALSFTACADSNTNDTADLSQHFTGNCPFAISGYMDNTDITISTKNSSDKTILAYNLAIVYMDSSGKIIAESNGETLFNAKTTSNLSVGDVGTEQYNFSTLSSVNSAIVYACYAHFSDQSTWGYEEMTVAQIKEYGKSFPISKDLSNYYKGNSEVVLSYKNDGSCLVENRIWLTFQNSSEKSVVAYEAMLVQYNVYGDKLSATGGTGYDKITGTPLGDSRLPGGTDFK